MPFVRRLSLSALLAGSEGLRFVVEDDSFGHGLEEVRMKVLKNTETGEMVEVAYNAGGRTQALELLSPATGLLKSVLLDNKRNASDVWANTGWRGDMLAPYANRIKNGTYSVNGKTYYLERNEDRSPYGLDGLHGYLYRKAMTVEEATGGDGAAQLRLSYNFDGTDPGYPFPLRLELTYSLSSGAVWRGPSIFEVTWKAINLGQAEPLPFFNSWHAYFKVPDISKAVLTLDKCSSWNHVLVTNDSNVDSDLIPTGLTAPFLGFDGSKPIGGTFEKPTYWDDEFKMMASPRKCQRIETRVTDPSTGETSVLFSDHQFRWIQVYTGTAAGQGEQAIAVEAMSGEADAWNNMQGMRLLQASEQWEGSFGVRLDAVIV